MSKQQSKRYRKIKSNKKQTEDFLDHNEQIIIYEMDETGMDDFHGANG